MLDALWIDIRHSLRRLYRSPGLSLTVVLTLALVIGANTTVFSLLNAVVIRAVGASDPDRLVGISATDVRTGRTGYIYRETFMAFRAQQASFSGLSMYSGGGIFRVESGAAAFDVGYEGVMPDYFGLVGARLAVGRFLTEADGSSDSDAAPPVVITDRLWRRVFDGDLRAVGSLLKVDGRPMTIVGVTGPGFHGLQFDLGVDLFVPISLASSNSGRARRQVRAGNVVGRLAPGVTLAEARAELLARWPTIQSATIAELSPSEQSAVTSQRVDIESLAGGFSLLRREYGTALVMLVGLAVLLLAIGSANLTGLMLARTLARQNEIAVRLALGGSRLRLFQQSLIDGLLLALCGFVGAMPLAWGGSQILTSMLTVGRVNPLLRSMTPDARVLMIAFLVTVGTGLLIGVIPAWRTVKGGANDALKGRAIARTLGRSGRLVLTTQVVLSMMLVVSAGLFAGTLSSLNANDAQVRARPVVFTRLTRSPGERGTTLGQPYFQGLLQQLSAISGVDAAAYSAYFPAYLGFAGALPTDGYTPEGASDGSLALQGLTEFVSPGFFDLFGIAQLRGRDFTWSDNGQARPVAIVSESLAVRLFPLGDAIDRRVRISSGSKRTDVVIVGVVADAPIGHIREPHQAVLFRPMMQDLAQAQSAMAHVRVTGNLNAVREAYVRVVESQRRHYVRGLLTLDEWIDNALVRERLIAGMSTSAAALAVVLACLGLYGLLAHAVVARMREIGIRMSLGATRAAIVRMVLGEGLRVVVPGVLVGIPCALGAAWLIRWQLYGVTPTDPRVVIGAAVVFMVTGVVASLLPALRASQTEPTEALRQE